MWEDTRLELHVKENLHNVIGQNKAEDAYACYVNARNAVLKLSAEIKAKEPNLSDHGPVHIHDVLENAWGLVEGQGLCVLNLYVLALSIAYHDIGNFFGRKNHNKKIAEIFNETFPEHYEFKKTLRSQVTKIAGAHTGKARDGSDNTLQDLVDDTNYIHKKPIKMRSLAGILRFADEMAEGPQRTSGYRLTKNDYDEISKPFHVYASCCEPCASHRERGSLFLNYSIPIEIIKDKVDDSKKNTNIFSGIKNLLSSSSKTDNPLIVHNTSKMPLSELLDLIYHRVIKFDQERKYCRYYSSVLDDFKETSVVIEFSLNDEEILPLDLKPLVLSDLVVPGDVSKTIHSIDPAYDIPSIIDKINRNSE
ncbi:hypothetical protein O4H49_06360 [Kiloniella laminariae]|uniref:HD-CE domain-containing protein n=1 Tax=Kiloniella laminariae TaxID=454162 RepID=A0ABT4LH10_9PROT|nr:hypothetical protein [Kiloniella laminariae]MCZ4280391.1 hypothetical protein [Kiloniella laminariae]